MDSVVGGRPINLPNMMIWYIADCASKKKSSLPYGMVLSKIFLSQGIVISDSEPRKNLRHTDFYSLATIHRMGFTKKNGVWVRKGQIEDRATDIGAPGPSVRDSSPVPPCPSTSVPAPSAQTTDQPSSSSTGFSDLQLEQIKSLLDAQEARLKTEFEQVLAHQTECYSVLKNDLKLIFEKLEKIGSSLDFSVFSMSKELQKMFEKLDGVGEGSKKYLNATDQLSKDIFGAVLQIEACLEKFKKEQKDDILEIIGHLKSIVFKHVR